MNNVGKRDDGSADSYYFDGLHYDADNRNLRNDIPFYLRFAQSQDSPVLELGCGTGRVTLPLARAGVEVVGVDNAIQMLETGRAKAKSEGLNIEWVLSDVRTLSLSRRFPLVIAPFNVLQQFHTCEDIQAFFASVKRHLAEQGLFVFDVFNPDLKWLTRDPLEETFVDSYDDPYGQGPVRIFGTCRYDTIKQISRVRWRYEIGHCSEARLIEINMRCFFPEELRTLLHHNGFEVLEAWGSFESEPLSDSSKKIILLCAPRRGASQ